jgi:DNA-directed RNA polymerase specialized sigma24 family protein
LREPTTAGTEDATWEARVPPVWRRPNREVPVEPLSLLPAIVDREPLSPRTVAMLERLGELKRPPLIDPDARRHALNAVEELAEKQEEELVARQKEAERAGLQLEVRRMLRVLPPIERAVIRMRYGIGGQPLGVIETAERLGYSRTSIWAIERRALARLAGESEPSRTPGPLGCAA